MPCSIDRPLRDGIVAFYLTQESKGLHGSESSLDEVQLQVIASGQSVQIPALRVIFPRSASLEEPSRLLVFGSDPRQCDLVLTSRDIAPIHCTIYAQLNSGPTAWLVKDTSPTGTNIYDEEDIRKSTYRTLHQRRQLANNLSAIQIGRYVFRCRLPTNPSEIKEREEWFQTKAPILVTKCMLLTQLNGIKPELKGICMIGAGGNGKVFKQMEKITGLAIAEKRIVVDPMWNQEHIIREVDYMKTLVHVRITATLWTSLTVGRQT